MSDTESFEYALWKAIDDCKIDESTDTITGSYTKSLSNQDRVVAAHIREIRDTAQREYHRGYEDGRHSMDAEHRVIAMRLRGLRFDGDSHKNLRRIAYAIYPCATGWMCESAAGLRDKLIDLMGGVSDESSEPLKTINLNDEFNHLLNKNGDSCETGGADDTCDSQCRGACAAGDCGCAGEHAEVSDDCVDCDILGPDSRGHAVGCDFHELGVSDGRTGDSCTRSHPLRSVGRNDVCVCRDSGEHSRGQEVGHGGTTHDCADDSRGGSRGELVHMDGLEPTATVTGDGLTITSEDGDELRIAKDDILLNGKSIVKESIDGFLGLTATYDVLDNERRKAVFELRKLPEWYKDDGKRSPAGKFNEAIGDAIGVEGLLSFAKIRDRLIHLLGGDQPSGIDVLRAMDADGTCPNDVPTSSITDELREWASDRHCKGMSHTDVLNIGLIADRIDEQFDRICKQQEAVLQSTIDDVVKEYEHDRLPNQLRIEKLVEQRDEARQECADLLDLLRDAASEYQDKHHWAQVWHDRAEDMRMERDSLESELSEQKSCAEGFVTPEWYEERVLNMEKERDELRRKVDELESFDPETSIAAFGDDNGKLRRTLSRAATLLANAEQDRDANYAYWMDCKEKVVHANVTIEELQAKLDAIRDALDG